MKKVMVIIAVLALMTAGCASSMFGGGTQVTLKNTETAKIDLSDVVTELTEVYGDPVPVYRGYKNTEGEAHIIRDLHFSVNEYTTVVVSVVDDDVKGITTVTNQR